MVKLRDIALVGGLATVGYFLLRGGASAVSSGSDLLSGFAAGIESGIQQLTGSTPQPGPGSGSGSGNTPTPAATPNPPFPFLPTPPGTSIPTALGIGGANLGIGAAILGAGYGTGRYIAPALAKRIGGLLGRFRSPTSPNIDDLTTELSPVTLGEEAAGGLVFSIPTRTLSGKPFFPGAPTNQDIFGFVKGSPGDILVNAATVHRTIYTQNHATAPAQQVHVTSPVHFGPGNVGSRGGGGSPFRSGRGG